MKFSLNITDWQAVAPGLATTDEWRLWAKQHPVTVDQNQSLAQCCQLPMMTARRLSSGSRLAVECGLALLQRQPVDAVVYSSRHGELERNYRILQALAMKHSVSPTDFALSVHNSAVGTLTIAAQQPLVSSSLAAGVETFQQGLCEVLALHQAGYSRVLMVDFDGIIPDFYHRLVPPDMSKYPFAVALLIEPGKTLHCMTLPDRDSEPNLPQSLQFLQGWLGQKTPFVVTGGRFNWHWSG